MLVTIDIPAVPRSRTGAQELARLLPKQDEIEELFRHAAHAVLPVTFRLDGAARITFNEK